MMENGGLPIYEGTIPLEEVHSTHRRILKRAELFRNSGYIGDIPMEEVRSTHRRILERAEMFRNSGYIGDIPSEEVRETHFRPMVKAEALLYNDRKKLPEYEGVPAYGQDFDACDVSVQEAGVYDSSFASTESLDDEETAILDDGKWETGEGEGEASRETSLGEGVVGNETTRTVTVSPPAGVEKQAQAAAGRRQRRRRQRRPAAAVRRPIAVKLVGIVTTLLMLSLGALTVLVSILVSADVRLTAEDNNFSVNRRTAESVQTRLRGISAAVTVFYHDLDAIILTAGSATEKTASTAARYFFDQNPQIAAIIIDDSDFYINETFFADGGGDTNMPRLWNMSEGTDFEEVPPDSILLRNATPVFGIPMLVMRLPLENSIAKVFFDSETLNAMLGEGNNISFLLNEQGDVILHHDIDTLRSGANLYHIPFVKNILDNSGTNIQSIYTDGEGVEYFGAVQRLNIGNAILLTIIRTSIVFDGIVKTTVRNIVLSVIVLFVSTGFVILFSRTISRPLRALTNAVQKIEDGNYDLQLKVMSNDELGLLTENFIGMGNNLENFEKFTNKTIVKLAKQGKLSRSGENKKTTVAFVFIRDFHEISEGLNAEAVVDFVNDYLHMIVPCITRNGGSVDKFITQGGLIIMTLWGTPETAGSPKQDALNCMRALLSMRAALRCLNKSRVCRLGSHIPLIKMGCGVNTGEIISGQIGSEERMEYTVIGDAVNIAARIEGPNDLFDTDILISEETYKYVGDYLITKEMQSIEVKGKEKPLRLFAVVNMRDPIIGKDMLDDLKNFDGIDLDVCKKSIGSDGPRNMGDVRRAWGVDS
ncbi:MAG: HAMP domain-containing protein [Spirochaetaceae bacterium]|jgi:adenylate cyclase|nr:HAMP domain-containing protein [Spirochaetaceae bacterium]